MSNNDWLSKISAQFYPLFLPELTPKNTCLMDLSANNKEVEPGRLVDLDQLQDYISNKMISSQAIYGYGGYLEDREIYRRSPLFGRENEEPRSIHLGTDVWVASGSQVYLPLDGMVHSFNNNDQLGDYGPTIVVKHSSDDKEFYTLYGHLSLSSLLPLEEGTELKAGQPLCKIGEPQDNGQWPPHLHFQVIMDLGKNRGDFPGVCTPANKLAYQYICPDPMPFFKKISGIQKNASK